MSFDIELRVRINDELKRQAEVLKEKLSEPSAAALVRRLIRDEYKDVCPDDTSSRDAREKSNNDLEELSEEIVVSVGE